MKITVDVDRTATADTTRSIFYVVVNVISSIANANFKSKSLARNAHRRKRRLPVPLS